MKLIVYSIPIFFVLIALEIIYAQVRKSPLYRFTDAISNINCGILQQSIGALMKTLLIVGYIYVYNNWRVVTIPDHWLSWIALFISVDFFYYWFHRYAHEINIFWGTHVVHHQSEEYNLSVALRQSTFQSLVSTWFYLPLAFLGFSPVTFFVIATLQTLYQFWIHTRVIDKMPSWFEYVFNTPSHHRVHHGRNPKYIDKNHGGTLILFDRWFGTFQAEEEEVVYGVTTPLRTWNPVWANFDYYRTLWREIQKMPTLLDKLKLLIKKPGWRPVSIGGSVDVPVPDPKDRIRLRSFNAIGVYYYVGVQFLFLLGIASFYLNAFQNLSDGMIALLAVFIVWSILNINFLLEQKKIAIPLEIPRILFQCYVLYQIFSVSTLL